MNPTTGRVYVTNISGNVSVIDGATNLVTATVPVGFNPWAVGVNPTTNRVYVANRGSKSVSVIDGATNAVTATVPVGTSPQGVGVNPITNQVYVAKSFTISTSSTGNVSVIDGATNLVTATVPVGFSPFGVGVNPTTERVYVANQGSDSVSVIFTATAIAAAVARVKGGKALLRMRCRGPGDCRGAARLVVRVKAGKRARSRVRNLVIARRRRFSIPAGKTKVIRLRLTRRGKALARKAGRRGLRAKLRGSGLKRRTVRLRAKRAKR